MSENKLYRNKLSGSYSHGPSLDTIVSRNIMSQLRRDPPGVLPEAAGPRGPDTSADVVSSMARRLGQVEGELREKNVILQRMTAENDALKSKLKVAEEEIARHGSRGARPSSPSHSHSDPDPVLQAALAKLQTDNERLRRQCKSAWKQVADIKEFLNDYGMVWVGDPQPDDLDSPSATHSPNPPLSAPKPPLPASQSQPCKSSGQGGKLTGNNSPAQQPQASHGVLCNGASSALPGHAASEMHMKSCADSPLPPGVERRSLSVDHMRRSVSLPFNLQELHIRVEELNQLAGDGEGQVVRGQQGAHVLHTPEPVNLTVYSDGLQLFTQPARPYDDPAVKAILADVMDGYFPIALKKDFPNGVPIKLVDCTSSPMPRPTHPHSKLGAQAYSNIHSFDDIESSANASSPQTKTNFLNKLPQSVIRNGKVIEIRSEIARAFDGKQGTSSDAGDGIELIQTPVDALLSTVQRNHAGPNVNALPRRISQEGSGELITTLQIKSEDGKQTYIVKLRYTDNIGSLRSYLDSHRKVEKRYEIRTAYPARSYENVEETLAEANLVPNATLFLRPVQG